jgi:predicted alpha/beta-hydrolase family hydrolase
MADWRVSVDGESVSAVFEEATAPARAVFVCAHGAGGNMGDRGLVRAAQSMRAAGLGVVRFNFPYRERKSGRPDPMPRLEACVAAVAEKVRAELAPARLILGGRSMGGRAASMLCATGFACDALLLLAYPLHPPGQPQKLRDAHLPAIRVPVLCFNGTRDAFCDRALMERVLQGVATTWTMHWIEAADHSFHVPKSSGRTDAEVFEEVEHATREWLSYIFAP